MNRMTPFTLYDFTNFADGLTIATTYFSKLQIDDNLSYYENMCNASEFYLADDRGQWLGDKHYGFIEMPVLIEQNYHFPDTGRYYMAIQHGMRDSLLRGVTDIGVEIKRNGQE